MEIDNRKSIYCPLKDLKYGWNTTDSDFIEITKWINGEGWDIHFEHGKRVERFSLHIDDLEIINYLIKHMDYGVE